ncbi:hypothetical protein EIP91_011371 [Steccherinum ochraceum]|uniref:DUF7704 domain-containing protein n=1 Tax=Steccherinum ochraceum TaxID=92696 RepID=A0A4R0RRW3_9APHY|nr:hypothetical protein EIP91_011371 [Steccherinum ochraceum]
MVYQSAIPSLYLFIFGWYEPLLTLLGCTGAILWPKEAHDRQAPWPSGAPPPDSPLALATLVTLVQLAQTVGLLGLINFFVLGATKRYLSGQPAVQEKIVSALLTPLLLGDISHLGITLWALGDARWDVMKWKKSGTLWLTVVTGLSLLLPRVAWHLGFGRYVHRRDGRVFYGIKRA